VQAAVHGQDVLGGEPAGFVVLAPADGEPVVGGLDLQRGELLERPGAKAGSHVVAQQRGVPGHRPRAQAAADVGQPTVQVLVHGELGRVVDEVGYIPFEAEAANLFFQLVSARYERQPDRYQQQAVRPLG
jgi:hypothetical protein